VSVMTANRLARIEPSRDVTSMRRKCGPTARAPYIRSMEVRPRHGHSLEKTEELISISAGDTYAGDWRYLSGEGAASVCISSSSPHAPICARIWSSIRIAARITWSSRQRARLDGSVSWNYPEDALLALNNATVGQRPRRPSRKGWPSSTAVSL